jgi:hypothetical protein
MELAATILSVCKGESLYELPPIKFSTTKSSCLLISVLDLTAYSDNLLICLFLILDKKKAYRLSISFSLYYKQTQICELYFGNNLPRILKGGVGFVCCEVTPYPASDSILLIGYDKVENLQIWRLSIK